MTLRSFCIKTTGNGEMSQGIVFTQVLEASFRKTSSVGILIRNKNTRRIEGIGHFKEGDR